MWTAIRIPILALGVLVIGGCAFPGAVQRVAVEYNSAVANMANELTLLNIMRAYEDLPLHYTTVSILRGNITVKTGGSINSALRGDTSTITDQVVDTVATAVAPAGTTTTTTSQITGTNQVLEGVPVTTPTLSGEITTGPTFDVAVLDTQKFYNGILGSIPFSTVENYIGQGLDNQFLIHLLIERVDINRVDNKDADGNPKPETVASWVNNPGTEEGRIFAERMRCYILKGTNLRVNAVNLVPASRVRRTDASSLVGLTMQEIALLDGKTLEVSEPIGTDPQTDDKVIVRRPASSKRVAELVPRPAILEEDRNNVPDDDKDIWDSCKEVREARKGILPKKPPSEALFLGDNLALVLGPDGKSAATAKAEISIVFRSAESVIRYVGRYLRATEEQPGLEPLNGGRVFSITKGKPSGSVVSCELLGTRYSIANDADRRTNMQVIAIIQQLINLHKESTDRPQTIPVQVVGG
jgi:hypothetical protein